MVLAPLSPDWGIDSGASYHTILPQALLSRSHPPHSSHPASIVIGNGSTLLVTSVCALVLLGPFYLNDVLVAPISPIISFLSVSSPPTILVPLRLTPLVFL
jgi:hypothetical protein